MHGEEHTPRLGKRIGRRPQLRSERGQVVTDLGCVAPQTNTNGSIANVVDGTPLGVLSREFDCEANERRMDGEEGRRDRLVSRRQQRSGAARDVVAEAVRNTEIRVRLDRVGVPVDPTDESVRGEGRAPGEIEPLGFHAPIIAGSIGPRNERSSRVAP